MSFKFERTDTAGGEKNSRTLLYLVIGVFLAALVGVFVWGDALMPTSHDGQLNSRPVDGSTGLKQ